jgi:hypothetical protein
VFGRKLSPNDYLLGTAFSGVLIVAFSNGLYDPLARYGGAVLGAVIVLAALGLGVWQGRKKQQDQ